MGAKARSTRVERVESEMVQILSEHLQHGLHSPLPCYASVTNIVANPDLRHAKVFFRLVGDENQVAEAKDRLQRERAHFQRKVARLLTTKFCPVLKFEFGVARGGDSEIDRLLSRLHQPYSFED